MLTSFKHVLNDSSQNVKRKLVTLYTFLIAAKHFSLVAGPPRLSQLSLAARHFGTGLHLWVASCRRC